VTTVTAAADDAYWAAERYQAIATSLAAISEGLCDRAGARPGEFVLDAATATGNAALAAARRGCRVTGIDIDDGMLAVGRSRAAAESLPVTFERADVQNLPYPDNSFDLVLSTYGAMFAPDFHRTARELSRVCRPSGRIALANWDAGSVITRMFQVIHEHHPAVRPVSAAVELWATPEGLRELFGPRARIETWPSYRHVTVASSAE
jgi:ubiquinone/menaquinone biosynthesis C-methylase UbiE